MNQITIFKGQDNEVQINQKDGLYSLTDIWKASGSDKKNFPARWLRTDTAKNFVNHISQYPNMDIGKVVKTVRGGNASGTFAHWQIALAYAKYLSPELHSQVNQVFKERLEEDQNPALGIDRAVDRAQVSYLKQGKDNKWISKRIISKGIRAHFTDTLQEHGCDGTGIGMNTNSQYVELFGAKANELKEQRGLEKSSNLRDSLSMTEIAAISFAESLAADRIEQDGAQGNYSCNKRSKMAAKSVRGAIESFNKPAELAAEQARKQFFDKYKSA